MEIQMQIGTKVWANGKKAGTVSKIIVDPESSKPAYLVVRRGRLLKRDIVVPVGLVQSIADERIHLSMNTDELDSFPSYEVTIDKGSIPSLVPLKSNPFTMHVQKADRGFFKSTQRNVPERDIALHEVCG